MAGLTLTRYPGQSINIGEDIRVRVLERKGEQVRLSIQAPKNIPIHREEIYQKIKLEKSNEQN